jgi:hypothetical protein
MPFLWLIIFVVIMITGIHNHIKYKARVNVLYARVYVIDYKKKNIFEKKGTKGIDSTT